MFCIPLAGFSCFLFCFIFYTATNRARVEETGVSIYPVKKSKPPYNTVSLVGSLHFRLFFRFSGNSHSFCKGSLDTPVLVIPTYRIGLTPVHNPHPWTWTWTASHILHPAYCIQEMYVWGYGRRPGSAGWLFCYNWMRCPCLTTCYVCAGLFQMSWIQITRGSGCLVSGM